MSSSQTVSRQEWVAHCAFEMSNLIPELLNDFSEEFSLAFLMDWADAIWNETLGRHAPDQAAWVAVNELLCMKAAKQAA